MQLPKRKPGKYSQIPHDNAMSQKKYDELILKLDRLKQKRPALAREVSRLAEMGDFSENVEYQLAKGRLRGVNQGILELEYAINHAEIIESGSIDTVGLGSVVTIKTDNWEKTYTILGASEADPGKGIISHLSPLGSALLGHKVGDVVEVEKVGSVKIVSLSS